MNCVNGLPVDTQAAESDSIINTTTDAPTTVSIKAPDTSSSNQKLDKSYYLTRDWSESVLPFNVSYSASERKNHWNKLIQSKPKTQIKRRRGGRRANRQERTTEVPVVKTTKAYSGLPSMFISNGWGPGR